MDRYADDAGAIPKLSTAKTSTELMSEEIKIGHYASHLQERDLLRIAVKQINEHRDWLVQRNIKLEKERDEWKRKAKEGQWISVKERLPESMRYCLVYTDSDDTWLVWFDGKNFFCGPSVTHWRELPTPPNENRRED
jgi:hypothetical protein